jgi:hypothetical protein
LPFAVPSACLGCLRDAVAVRSDTHRAFVNPPAALWGTALYAVGLHATLRAPWRRAVRAAVAATAAYVLCVSSVIR